MQKSKRSFKTTCLLLIAVVITVTACFFIAVANSGPSAPAADRAAPVELPVTPLPTETPVAPVTATPVPAPTNTLGPTPTTIPTEPPPATDVPPPTDTVTPNPTDTPLPPPTAVPTACDCSADVYNCPDFGSPYAAQQCYLQCRDAGAGDVHRLDRDGDGNACEWDN